MRNTPWGSVLNHVMLHQTVIGLEAEQQMKLAEDYPDVIIGCVGGAATSPAWAFPFIRHKIAGKDIRFVACEPHFLPLDEPRPNTATTSATLQNSRR